ncbi:MAG: TetR/AcrR family transcriptional regulator [Gammaproteobacteria bacterium]|nr:TetR/AcrR family transcriptional regulator [Gammaproteobacteria bacterium]MDD9959222.1 TetR/AcrR family transcriptional regulator [Gammaproteobacteria bacterium]
MAGRPRKAEPDVALAAAMNAFWAKGYESTSMSDLTEATGLHKASLYQSFGDKHQLFVSALKLYFAKTAKAQKDSRNGEENPIEALKKSVDTTIDQCAEGKGCLAVNSLIEVAPFDDEIDRILKQFRQRLDKHLANLVDEAKQKKLVAKSVDTKEAVKLISVFMHGLTANMAAGMSVNKARALLHDQLDLVLSSRKKFRSTKN